MEMLAKETNLGKTTNVNSYNPPEPHPSIFVGRKGDEIRIGKINKAVKIKGRKYCDHAIDRLRERGLTPSIVENTIKIGKVSPDPKPGRLRHYDIVNNITVITDKETGDVISAFFGER
ncbi:hypothetical protein ACFLYH_01895 [Candidatus Dependentiae bacterium]